jgi:PAS domain S-box-containing protein
LSLPFPERPESFRLLVQSVRDYAIFLLDPTGRVATWNSGAEHIKGYRADEIVGRHFSTFYPPEAIAKGWPEHELKVAQKEGRFEDEGWRLRKDGSRFWANVVITALFEEDGSLVGFAKVTRDLTERKRMEALQESDTQKNEFLAMLSHELRNPLAPIRNALEVMQKKSSGDPVVEWARAMIDRQVGHLSRLVDDLLDVSRIVTHKITLKKEPVEVAELVSAAVEVSRPLIDSRGHTLEVEVPDEPLWIEGDLTRLSQALLNLLNNAAKYTPDGGRIWLTAEREGTQVLLRVRDTGIGIPTELLPKVFDLFRQGDRALDRSEGGLGIGLTLVQQIALRHGGSVEAWSEGAGRGAEFLLRLPMFLTAGAEGPLQTGAPDLPAQTARRVLVVDDNRDAASTLEMLLQIWGHDVRVAHNGTDALADAAEYQPELVLLDIGLPGMDGYEVAQRLREIRGLEKVAIVAVTGYGQEDDRRRSREARFDQHLVKPVDPLQLQQILAAADRVDADARPASSVL